MIFEGTKKSIFFGLGLTRAGESLPTVDNLYALSRLLHTSVDDILIGEKERDDEPSLSFSFYIFFGFLVLLNVHFISSISSPVAEIGVSLTLSLIHI